MCRVMEDMRDKSLREGIEQGMKQAALRMIRTGKYSLKEIFDISGLSLEEIEDLQAGQNA